MKKVEKTIMISQDNEIYVDIINNNAMLRFPTYNIETNAYIGENGVTMDKKEGDGKTPLGEFNLGIILGTHLKEEIEGKMNSKYIQITENMYWIDDVNSKYYNQLVDITNVIKDWNSAEHLIDYPIQYEYLINIEVNPNNIPGNGSAIFLHCKKGNLTKGCIAIPKDIMQKIIKNIDENTKIIIRKI